MLEIGKSYSFKTLTFYYTGTVTELYPTHARLRDAMEIFETGPNASYYKGEVKNQEKVPDGILVPIGAGIIIAPWSRVLG